MGPFLLRIAALLLAALSGAAIHRAVSTTAVATDGAAPPPMEAPAATAEVSPAPVLSVDVAGLFGSLRAAMEAATVDAPPEPGPTWSVRTRASSVPGARDAFASVSSLAPPGCGAGRPATLVLRCLDDRTEAFVAHGCRTPPTGDGWPVSIAFDGKAAAPARLVPDAEGGAFGLWEYRPARELMEALTDRDAVTLRFEDAGGTRATLSFPVSGAAEAVRPLAKACGWSFPAPWRDEANAAAGPPGAPAAGDGARATPGDSAAAGAERARWNLRAGGPLRRVLDVAFRSALDAREAGPEPDLPLGTVVEGSGDG